MLIDKKMLAYKCDCCGTTEDVDDYDLPEGWKKHQQHNCGLTNYSRTIDLCEECYPKVLAVEKKEREENRR